MQCDESPEDVLVPQSLGQVKFSADFVQYLPGDHSFQNFSRETPHVCYSLVSPTRVAAPTLLGWSKNLGHSLGIAEPTSDDRQLVEELLSGNRILPGMRPYAARYGGHQFGHWAGQLGDGRAMTLGEFKDPGGRIWELQLKGAGPTPYSRRADGRAVLRSSLREFLCSEAMHFLGVPTTRALSLVLTGDPVLRDMFYDGNPGEEPGAITSRLAPTFLRFGSFQILSDAGEIKLLKQLADYAITVHFPELLSQGKNIYESWFIEVCKRTAKLIADWQRIGFVHGVMNTDNMSIAGLTIDYGPYGWLEGFDLNWTPNTTDAHGRRYCYGRQPQIGQWNIQRFGEALLPLFSEHRHREILNNGTSVYAETFRVSYQDAFARKIGLRKINSRADLELIQDLLDLLEGVETDMTIFFRNLGAIDISKIHAGSSWDDMLVLHDAFYNLTAVPPGYRQSLLDWMRRYAVRALIDHQSFAERRAEMDKENPKFVLRNYLAQQAIDDLMQGSRARFDRLLERLEKPFVDQHDDLELAAKRPEWARFKAGCSALSCSS